MHVTITLDTDNTQDVLYLSNLLGTNAAPAFTHELGRIDVAELKAGLEGLADEPNATEPQETKAEEAPKRKRRTKAEIEADKAAEEAAKLPDDEQDTEVDDFSTRLESAKERASALVASDKVHIVRDALAAAGDVKRVTLLDESNLSLFIAALDKAEADSEDLV